MSIMMLKKRFAGGLGQAILYALIVVLAVGMVLMFSMGGGSGGGRMSPAGGAAIDKDDVVANVNGQPLSRATFEEAYQQAENMNRQYGQTSGGIDRGGLHANRGPATGRADRGHHAGREGPGVQASSREIEAAIAKAVDDQVVALKQQAKDAKPEQMERFYGAIVAQNGGARDSDDEREEVPRMDDRPNPAEEPGPDRDANRERKAEGEGRAAPPGHGGGGPSRL